VYQGAVVADELTCTKEEGTSSAKQLSVRYEPRVTDAAGCSNGRDARKADIPGQRTNKVVYRTAATEAQIVSV